MSPLKPPPLICHNIVKEQQKYAGYPEAVHCSSVPQQTASVSHHESGLVQVLAISPVPASKLSSNSQHINLNSA